MVQYLKGISPKAILKRSAKKMRPIFALFLLMSSTGCDRQPTDVGATPPPKSETTEADDPLLRGLQDYEASLTRLQAYCDAWAAEYIPITEDELTEEEPWVSDVYEIFEDFWTPTEPYRLAGDDDNVRIGNPYYGSPFLVLQPSVSVSFIETLDEDADDASERTIAFALKLNELAGEDIADVSSALIDDFRPRVSAEGQKIVRLTEARQRSLLAFLGDEHHPVGAGNIMSPAAARGESRNRARYVSHCLPVIHGHFKGWHLITHPKFRRILMNTAGTEAHIDFQFVYQGGTAYYERRDGEWIMTDSEFTWVQ